MNIRFKNLLFCNLVLVSKIVFSLFVLFLLFTNNLLCESLDNHGLYDNKIYEGGITTKINQEENYDKLSIHKQEALSQTSGHSSLLKNDAKQDKSLNQAANLPETRHSFWGLGRISHYSRDERLANLIRELCAMQNIGVSISQDLQNQDIIVNKNFKNIYPSELWDQIVQAYGLSWFFDGNVLYVYKGEEVKTKVLNVSSKKVDTLFSIIKELNFSSSSLSIRSAKDSGIVFITGTPKFLELSSDLIERINDTSAPKELEIKTFILKHAWADDANYGSVKIQGVKSLLNSILKVSSSKPESKANESDHPKQIKGTIAQKKEFEDSKNSKNSKNSANNDNSKFNYENEYSTKKEISLPNRYAEETITTDSRLNAIIVCAFKENMERYESLIKSLDIPLKLVEIAAAIVDVDSSINLSHGMNYLNVKGRRINLEINPVRKSGDATSSLTGMTAGFTGLVNKIDFSAKLSVLTEAGFAHVLCRPQVTTFNNTEAKIKQDTTYYISVGANKLTDLYPVSAGTSLKVVPHIIENSDGSARRITLLVEVESGQPSAGSAGAPPSTTSSNVTTQAVIDPGQSLLIGGCLVESNISSEAGVPVLKDIPFFGNIFKYKAHDKNLKQRLFLITPKVVELSAETDPAYSQYFENVEQGESVLQSAGVYQNNLKI